MALLQITGHSLVLAVAVITMVKTMTQTLAILVKLDGMTVQLLMLYSIISAGEMMTAENNKNDKNQNI